jgi:hypothetical protein
MLALARAKWHTLSKTQKRALVGASAYGMFGVCLTFATPIATADALTASGICGDAAARRKLTGLGAMVREAGVYARASGADR